MTMFEVLITIEIASLCLMEASNSIDVKIKVVNNRNLLNFNSCNYLILILKLLHDLLIDLIHRNSINIDCF